MSNPSVSWCCLCRRYIPVATASDHMRDEHGSVLHMIKRDLNRVMRKRG
jgi:hypothetical protein